jgi:hypothetical protein
MEIAGRKHYVPNGIRDDNCRGMQLLGDATGERKAPRTFQHLMRKKDVIVFVDFRNGFIEPLFSHLPVCCSSDEANSMATRLKLVWVSAAARGVCDS